VSKTTFVMKGGGKKKGEGERLKTTFVKRNSIVLKSEKKKRTS
jgi:hypothetical protein